MFAFEREEYLELLNSMQELHVAIRKESDAGQRNAYLEDCQQAAISLGEHLEEMQKKWSAIYAEVPRIVSILEEYCETAYRITMAGVELERGLSDLNIMTERVSSMVRRLPLRYKVAFFPYKAAMWDSLESIYFAAAEDEYCDTVVCPVPYFENDQTRQDWIPKYEGAYFPKDIPIVFYGQFSLSDENIDIAYIHNPYNDSNLVTSVHSDYYSSALAKHVGKLVYVPYYANEGQAVSEVQKHLPVYRDADYIVVQTERAKESCRGLFYYDKILPFGSPKFDRLVRGGRGNKELQEGWHTSIGERRGLLLNTSISDLLNYNELMIKKLEFVFGLVREYADIAIIWRPHPLLKPTIKAMRPMLLAAYENLEREFAEYGLGILDTTADGTDAILFSDGYMGSAGSSMVMQYEVTGKPMFLFDYRNHCRVSQNERMLPYILAFERAGDRVYFITAAMNVLASMDLSDEEHTVKVEAELTDTRRWSTQYWDIRHIGGRLYICARQMENNLCFDIEQGKCEKIKADLPSAGQGYWAEAACGDSIYFIPLKGLDVLRYDIKKDRWRNCARQMSALIDGLNINPAGAVIRAKAVWKDKVYFSTDCCARIVSLSTAGKADVIQMDRNAGVPILIRGANEQGLWIVDLQKPWLLYCAPWNWLEKRNHWKKFNLKPFLLSDMELYEGDCLLGEMVFTEKFAILIPKKFPRMVCIDKESGTMKAVAEGFWRHSDEDGIMAAAQMTAVCRAVLALGDNRILVQRNRDCQLAIIDCMNDRYEEWMPVYGEREQEILNGQGIGFDIVNETNPVYAMRESRVFPMEYFLEGFSRSGFAETRESQLEAASVVANNLDGTCGEKIHRFVLDGLEGEE